MSEFMTKPVPQNQPDTPKVTRPWGSFVQYANNREDITRYDDDYDRPEHGDTQ